MEEGTHGQDPMHQPQCFIFLIPEPVPAEAESRQHRRGQITPVLPFLMAFQGWESALKRGAIGPHRGGLLQMPVN